MQMRAKTRAKRRAQAQEVLAAPVIDFLVGNARGNPKGSSVQVVLGWSAIAFVLVLATGRLFTIGALPFYLGMRLLSPPRGLAVTPFGVATLRTSAWSTAPTGVRALVPFHLLHPMGAKQGLVQVQVGHESIWFTSVEAARLRAALVRATDGAVASGAPQGWSGGAVARTSGPLGPASGPGGLGSDPAASGPISWSAPPS